MSIDHEGARADAKARIEPLFEGLAEVLNDDKMPELEWINIEADLKRFEIASLLRVMLFHVCAFKGYGPEEKLLWGILLHADGHFISLSHRKFGLRGAIGAPGAAPDAKIVRRLIGKLMQSVQITEKYLEVLGASQLQQHNVTVPNRFSRLSSRYTFFREHAKTSFEAPTPPPTHLTFDSEGRPTSSIYHWFKGQTEGGYFAIAMMDAYFSRLEHLLVLVLPFLNRPLQPLIDFIGSTWHAKLLHVMDLRDPINKKLYDELKQLKERQRNVFAHGDFEKQGASLYFHVGKMCAVPVALSAHSRSAVYGYHAMHIDSFAEICQIFDRLDDRLQTVVCPHGWRFADAGLDVSFDQRSVAHYTTAMVNEATFDAYIERQCYLEDQAINMDF